MIADDQWGEIVIPLLANGVPPTTIARAFNLPRELILDFQRYYRRTVYGTDELTEAMSYLMWEAYDEAVTMIRSGNINTKIRFIPAILARTLPLVGRQTPEDMSKIRGELESMMSDMQPAELKEASIYEPATPSLDGETDDPEEGSRHR